jgi:hypothetical protein
MTGSRDFHLSGGQYSRLYCVAASLQAAKDVERAEEADEPSVCNSKRQATVNHVLQGSMIRNQREQ